MRLAKQRGIHCTPENWERIRRRARKANETISRFGELCCRRAAEALGAPPSAPPGHPLALPEDDQRRLLVVKHALLTPRNPARSMSYRADRHRTRAPINTQARDQGTSSTDSV